MGVTRTGSRCVRAYETMGESAREYIARFVYNVVAGMLQLVYLVKIREFISKLYVEKNPFFTYAALMSSFPFLVIQGLKLIKVFGFLEYVLKVKIIREEESTNKPTDIVAHNEKLVLGALDVAARGSLLLTCFNFGPAMAALIHLTSIMIVPTCTQIRYGAVGAPPKRLTLIGMVLCCISVLMLGFMKPLSHTESYWTVNFDGREALRNKIYAFFTLLVCGVVNASKIIVTARMNKSVTDETKQFTPTEVLLMSSVDASFPGILPAFCLDMTVIWGFHWVKFPFLQDFRRNFTLSIANYHYLGPTSVKNLSIASLALGLAVALKILVEAKTVTKNLPWYDANTHASLSTLLYIW